MEFIIIKQIHNTKKNCVLFHFYNNRKWLYDKSFEWYASSIKSYMRMRCMGSDRVNYVQSKRSFLL